MLAGRRYIVCRNHQEAQKDAADRASRSWAALERQLAKGDKALVGNTGYRRYLKTISDDHFAIDPDKIKEDEKFDGIFVLRTNTDLNPLESNHALLQASVDGGADLPHRQAPLWPLDRSSTNSMQTIRGHVFCSFLALVLKKALEDRIAAFGRSWFLAADHRRLGFAGPRPRSSRTASTSSFAPRHVPPPASPCGPPNQASRCHRPCAKPPADRRYHPLRKCSAKPPPRC